MALDRGGRSDTRQRRALQKMAADAIGTLGIGADFVLTSGSYADPTWITSLDWSKIAGTPTTLSGYGITDAYTKAESDALYAPIAGPFPWSGVTSTPTTLAGYGITDPVVLTSGNYADPAWITSLAWSKITGTPTTLAGYGITDPVALTSGSYANPTWITSLAWSKLTGTPTTLAGYGITDAVPSSRQVAAGNGLTGGGDLSADRTLSIDLAADSGLEFSSGDLRVRVKTAGGITRDSDGLSTTLAFAQGTYTPTASAFSNVDSTANPTAVYFRVGNLVVVFGRVTVNATMTATLTAFDLTLPIAPSANFSSATDAFGNSSLEAGASGRILSNTGTQTVRCFYTAPNTGDNFVYFIFAYRLA